MPARNVDPAELDALDRHIADVLLVEPRATHRSIAAQIGVTEATASARLRRLIDADLLAVTVAFDWAVAGYSHAAYVWVACDDRPIDAVATDIATIGRVQNVVAVLGGRADLFVNVLATGPADLSSIIDRIAGVRGVGSTETHLVLRNLSHRFDVAKLPIDDPGLPELPAPAIDLDDLDRELCVELASDARRSNREIARALATSERTIRNRLARLETAGLLRICTVLDPRALPELSTRAFVAVQCDGPTAPVAERLVKLPEVHGATITTGHHPVELVVGAPSLDDLWRLVRDEIRAAPGVRSARTLLIGSAVRFATRLRRFV